MDEKGGYSLVSVCFPSGRCSIPYSTPCRLSWLSRCSTASQTPSSASSQFLSSRIALVEQAGLTLRRERWLPLLDWELRSAIRSEEYSWKSRATVSHFLRWVRSPVS